MCNDLFAAARRAAGISCEDAGKTCGISRVTYSQHESSPKDFRLSELRDMYHELSDTAKPIWLNAIDFFICGEDYVKGN